MSERTDPGGPGSGTEGSQGENVYPERIIVCLEIMDGSNVQYMLKSVKCVLHCYETYNKHIFLKKSKEPTGILSTETLWSARL